MWNFAAITELLSAALAEQDAALRLEQSVRGIDNLTEREIQGLLATALEEIYGVQREVHYPASEGQKLSARKRCDLCLSLKETPIVDEEEPSSTHLFDLWLEIKVAYQFREGGRKNPRYSSQWRHQLADDLRKMDADPGIPHAAVAMVVFTEAVEVAVKDLNLFELVLAETDVIAGFRHVRHFDIPDRIGHNVCTVALWPAQIRVLPDVAVQ